MDPEKQGGEGPAADETTHRDINRTVIADVLNCYAHGGTTEQSAISAGVDVATAYKIIADAIAAQQGPE
ncbi:hypothetical protein [Antarctobacter heliothermus]|uniref:Uncharacterized protein n=1 Tax=Antarctobacter heliothermus TaxID=74033 RepID=A0A239IJA5_9RHOB|nr:hypothetical protein [Antarctobacter heliothermus]SNS93492.1 hypothetical protein SAMN04488078_104319 [Antarctobacter heliothermus]